MAYGDGELSPEDVARVEAALADDPALAAEVRCHHAVRHMLSNAYDAPLREPVPVRLLNAVATRKLQSGQVIDFPRSPKKRTATTQQFLWPLAMAASLLLAVGIGSGVGPKYFADSAGMVTLHGGVLVATPPLAKALSTTASATMANLNDYGQITPQLSFAAADGTMCREFTLVSSAHTSDGVACLRGGEWHIEMLANTPDSKRDLNSYKTAAGTKHAAADSMIRQLGGGDAYDADTEAQLIKHGWVKQ